MTDHVEMLHLLALDARRVDDKLRAQIIFEAAEYLNFLEQSAIEEINEMRETITRQTSQIAALETELESLKS
jgi:hypothetical protein